MVKVDEGVEILVVRRLGDNRMFREGGHFEDRLEPLEIMNSELYSREVAFESLLT